MKFQNDTEFSHRDESGIERLPDEHVSIVETTDDREIARPVGTTRRKLYFNPAYFEPHLMAVNFEFKKYILITTYFVSLLNKIFS